MKSVWLTSVVVAVTVASATASDLNLNVRSAGQPVIKIAPGGTVTYTIEGELNNTTSGGLALFVLDLSFAGGALAQAGLPTTMPMRNFSSPLGFTNPAGFGGTPAGGNLLQIGGGQNTIHNTLAPTPTGVVVTDVAQQGAPVILASGRLTAPYQVGDFVLSASNVQANVLLPGQTGTPFWKVEAAGVGTISNLTVHVQAIRQMGQSPISVTAGQSMTFSIQAGPANAGRPYLMLGSLSGTTPGQALPGGVTLPLVNDRYYQYTQHVPNSSILSNSMGVLDAAGRATVTFHPLQRMEGQTAYHAFYLLGPGPAFASEATAVQVLH